MVLLYIPLMGISLGAQSADALYVARENIASAKRAAELWEDASKHDQGQFEAAWKLARICYWLGGHTPEGERRAYLEKGIAAGQLAARLQASSPEGHFWTAANMGALAESFGVRAGMKYRRPIREELETVLRIDPRFMDGSADRALGRYYFKVPSLLGGSKSRAEQHLRASLGYNQASTISHYFLAELLLDEGRMPEARAELQRVVDAPLSTEWAPEDREYKNKAAALLSRAR